MAGVYRKSRGIYQLLPAVHRERDAREGYPLRALLSLVEEQGDVLYRDIERLWDNFFIETCDPWVVPYIGDLVGNDPLHDADRFADAATAEQLFEDLAGPDLRPGLALRSRADVAKTIYYRRRKGTLPMLEELARDVTGWAAHGSEFFRLLGWSQNLNHPRPESGGSIALTSVEPLDRLDRPFDRWAHTVDVRAPRQEEGWYNIPHIGFFLWRLRSHPLERIAARQGTSDWQYHFSPLGNPSPLFNAWRREGDEAGLAGEYHVPGPIRPACFYQELLAHQRSFPRPEYTPLYAPLDLGGSLFIERNGAAVTPAADHEATPALYAPQILCRRLDPWPVAQPSGRVIAVDVESGRLAVGDGWGGATEHLDVSYHSGFPADLGGGPYERGPWLVDESLPDLQLFVQQENTAPGHFATLGAALAAWAAELPPRPNAAITILDSRSYTEPLDIELADGRRLTIQAANGARPHLLPAGGAVHLTGDHPESTLTLSGLLLEGGVEVAGELGRLRLLHSTLVPGRGLTEAGLPLVNAPSVVVAASAGGNRINADLVLEAAFCVTGPLRLPQQAQGMWLLDCIVDGIGGTAVSATGSDDEPGPAAVVERSTLLGASRFQRMTLGTEAIFTDILICAQRHEGCVRFSFVPEGSSTPRRYRCQPDWETLGALRRAGDAKGSALNAAEEAAIRIAIQAWMVPSFTSIHYGHPGYGQLRHGSPEAIQTGAEDGSEMGAYCHLKQPQRETNLRIRLEEYLPFGLVPGIIYVT